MSCDRSYVSVTPGSKKLTVSGDHSGIYFVHELLGERWFWIPEAIFGSVLSWEKNCHLIEKRVMGVKARHEIVGGATS